MAEISFEDWVKKQYMREYEKCMADYDGLSSEDKKEYRNDLELIRWELRGVYDMMTIQEMALDI